MLDDNVAALHPAGRTAFFQQVLQQLRFEAPARESQATELLGIDETAGAIPHEHKLVFLHDVVAAARLGIIEP